MNTQELAQSLHCGLFGSRDSIAEAYQYAVELSKASKDGQAMMTAIHVLMNSISKELKSVDSN